MCPAAFVFDTDAFCSFNFILTGNNMPKTVLIVEDYDDSRSLMKLIVERFGHTAIEAANGAEAILSVKSEIPNLILMDIGLPDLDGLETTRIIREYLAGITVPIVAVTAFGNAYFQAAIEAGCNYLITKPVCCDSLEPIFNKYLCH